MDIFIASALGLHIYTACTSVWNKGESEGGKEFICFLLFLRGAHIFFFFVLRKEIYEVQLFYGKSIII